MIPHAPPLTLHAAEQLLPQMQMSCLGQNVGGSLWLRKGATDHGRTASAT